MWELIEIVIPKIQAQWESLAYCMRYRVEEVKGFKREDLKECCKNLFGNWLTTDHGPKPKTYQTLLQHIEKIDELTAVSVVIRKKLIEGIDKHLVCIHVEVLNILLHGLTNYSFFLL